MGESRIPDNPVLELVWEVLQENWEQEAPVTYSVIGFVAVIFAAELVFTSLLDIATTRVFATGLFGVHPYVAWGLSPYLHRGVLHFLSSLVGLWLLGVPVEQHWNRWRFAVFLIVSGYLATAIGVAFMAPFIAQNVAFYGSSGMIYALGGFALVYFTRWFGTVRKSEGVAAIVGGVALVYVVIDPLLGPYFAADWVNGGHLGGFVIGVVVGFWKKAS